MSKKIEEKDGNERTKNLYRVTTKDDEGNPFILVLQSDEYQFKVAEEVMAGTNAKDAGEMRNLKTRFYPSALQAIMSMIDRLSKAEAKDLKGYVDALQKYRTQIIADCKGLNMEDPLVK